MATLNQKETEDLRHVKAALEYVLKHGYNPELAKEKDPQAVYTQKVLKLATKAQDTVIQMKGYYPK